MTTRRAARLTEADRAAWASFARSIAPLAEQPPPAPSVPPPVMPPPQHRATPPVPSRPTVAPLAIGTAPAGVDRATWQRFRTGKLAPARTLDLHGMTAQRAMQAVSSFLRAAQADRLRCVEVVTGRGGPAGTGVIRREFSHWLNLPELSPLILGAAHPHAANPGSVRLLLRRVR